MLHYSYLPAALRVPRVACLVGLFVIPSVASDSGSDNKEAASPKNNKRGRPVIRPIRKLCFVTSSHQSAALSIINSSSEANGQSAGVATTGRFGGQARSAGTQQRILSNAGMLIFRARFAPVVKELVG